MRIQKSWSLVILLYAVSLMAHAENLYSQNCLSDPEVVRQRKVLAGLDPASKVALWKQHLNTQLRTRSLTPDQGRVIQRGLDLITEDRYRANPVRAHQEESEPLGVLAVWAREIRVNFSKEEVLRIFNRIEPDLFDTFVSSIPMFMQVRFVLTGNCTCLVEFGPSYECLGSGLDCYSGLPGYCTLAPGCGDGGLFHCNGKCSQFPPEGN